MRMPVFAFGVLCAALLAQTPGAGAQTAEARIGVAAGVRNQVTATRSAQERPLAVGNSIFQNEIIRTGASSVAQLLFADQTTLSVGPRSEVTLDRFVYNPSQSTGDVAISLGRGALRFITGSQDPRSYSIRTPVATLGIRGTIVDFLLLDGRMFAILVEGGAQFTMSDGRELSLTVPGTALEFQANGAVSPPMTWSGRYEAGQRIASFPLYGSPFADTPWHEGADNLDSSLDRTDELSNRPSPTPPPPGPGP